MGSRSSSKSSSSSTNSVNNQVSPDDPLSSQAYETSENRPSSSTAPAWALWGGKSGGVSNETNNRGASDGTEAPKKTAVDTNHGNNESGWWKKSSISSLRAFSRSDSGTNLDTKEDSTTTTTKNAGAAELSGLSEPRRRAWSFWNRKSAENEENTAAAEVIDSPTNSTAAIKPIINELIMGGSNDAILFKKKSKDETATEQNLENENEEQGHLQNILTPAFEILPQLTTMNSLYSNMGKYGRKWHLLSANTLKPKSLYRRKAATTLSSLKTGDEKPIKVLLIGIHGFFPTRMIRPLIGEPTGTSTKFITEAEKAVIRWFRDQNTPLEISKIALEREGKVMDRVEFFLDVIKKWVDEINKADFIYFVAHSQGCPVSIILLAKLIEQGIIQLDQTDQGPQDQDTKTLKLAKKKVVSILAMAGVNNGPFYGVDQTLFVRAYSTIENDSLRELFQFQDFDSVLARKYIQSLKIIIASNVKVTFVGSINDQLVPLYSSTCLFARHPNIFRATFIDKDTKTPAFISRIVGIANQLNNLGFDDHGIIKEISGSLAGTLTGGGHSKIYNEGQVYDLGIKFALETSDASEDQAVKYETYQVDELGSNPYHLPWCMRGLLFETGVHIGREQISDLFREFEAWDPETKLLKDVKYRLSGLRSKL
ncbi:LAME_0H11870g1_1 [Lachancea meyersii CBS 8951]|uniref:LAME_0H11870g1_1 n=1 Tax=Lachancea meyersii CBS 8951 TaxID=1266667 RepID=A0A1G4KGE8_9SACH|nr:LAME_0H11870g1_1 [Lachancea meyersii CBS 8951]